MPLRESHEQRAGLTAPGLTTPGLTTPGLTLLFQAAARLGRAGVTAGHMLPLSRKVVGATGGLHGKYASKESRYALCLTLLQHSICL